MATDNPLKATPLSHGTRDAPARIILRDGVGCVLEARLAPHARWAVGCGDTAPSREGWDANFEASGLDAVRAYGGNVWVVWTPGVLVSVRRMSHREAIRRLCAEFDEDGPQCGYTGVVQDYASIW